MKPGLSAINQAIGLPPQGPTHGPYGFSTSSQGKCKKASAADSDTKAVARSGRLDPASIRSAATGNVYTQRNLLTWAAKENWNRLDKNTKRALISAMAFLHTQESKALLEKWLGEEKDEELRSNIKSALTQAWTVNSNRGDASSPPTGSNMRHSGRPNASQWGASLTPDRHPRSSSGTGPSAILPDASSEIARLKRLPLSDTAAVEEILHAAQGSSNAALRATAIDLLGRVTGEENAAQAADVLSELATSSWQQDEKYLGTLALGSLSRLAASGSDQAKRHVDNIFRSADSDKQALIIEQLRRYGSPETISFLMQLQGYEGISEDVRTRIQRAIADLQAQDED